MDISRIKAIKKVTQQVYAELPNQNHRMQIINLLDTSYKSELIHLLPSLANEALKICKDEDGKNVFTAFLFVDWSPKINAESINEFFENRNGLSKSKVAEEAGIHRNTLNDILRGRFGLTNDVAQKLLPILQKYGYKPD